MNQNDIKYVKLYEDRTIKLVAPKVTYKYRTFRDKNHIRLLTNRELYLASPSDFDDKKDCSLVYDTPTEGELFTFFLNNQPIENKYAPPCVKIGYAATMVRNRSLMDPEEIQARLREIDEEHFKHLGVLSMCCVCNSDYMWKEYADGHKGFCVGFDTEALFGHHIFGGGSMVNYYDELPKLKINGDENIILNLTSKLKCPYEKEREYRFFKTWNVPASVKDRVVAVPEDAVLCIILGKMMSEADRNKIRKIHREKYPHTELVEL